MLDDVERAEGGLLPEVAAVLDSLRRVWESLAEFERVARSVATLASSEVCPAGWEHL